MKARKWKWIRRLKKGKGFSLGVWMLSNNNSNAYYIHSYSNESRVNLAEKKMDKMAVKCGELLETVREKMRWIMACWCSVSWEAKQAARKKTRERFPFLLGTVHITSFAENGFKSLEYFRLTCVLVLGEQLLKRYFQICHHPFLFCA